MVFTLGAKGHARELIPGFLFSLADGEYDAAEIDKELISSRLKRDVLEHSGKVHLFIADSVRCRFSNLVPLIHLLEIFSLILLHFRINLCERVVIASPSPQLWLWRAESTCLLQERKVTSSNGI